MDKNNNPITPSPLEIDDVLYELKKYCNDNGYFLLDKSNSCTFDNHFETFTKLNFYKTK